MLYEKENPIITFLIAGKPYVFDCIANFKANHFNKPKGNYYSFRTIWVPEDFIQAFKSNTTTSIIIKHQYVNENTEKVDIEETLNHPKVEFSYDLFNKVDTTGLYFSIEA